jgi:hypothetical protein
MEYIKVFTTSFQNELVQRLKSEDVIRMYVEGKSPNYTDSDFKDTIFEVDGLPKINIENSDLENARILYESLRGINRTLASDPRLWTWLAHVPFMQYMSKRWPVPIEKTEEKQEEHIIRHWFIESQGANAYTRHGIAVLWWGADVSYDPERDDPFELTRELFSMLDYTRTLFGTLGRSKIFTHAFLEFVIDNPELFHSQKEAKIRFLMRRLNYSGSYMVIPSLSKEEIRKILDQYKIAVEKITG